MSWMRWKVRLRLLSNPASDPCNARSGYLSKLSSRCVHTSEQQTSVRRRIHCSSQSKACMQAMQPTASPSSGPSADSSLAPSATSPVAAAAASGGNSTGAASSSGASASTLPTGTSPPAGSSISSRGVAFIIAIAVPVGVGVGALQAIADQVELQRTSHARRWLAVVLTIIWVWACKVRHRNLKAWVRLRSDQENAERQEKWALGQLQAFAGQARAHELACWIPSCACEE